MEFIAVILLAALVFGGCYLVDKAFTKLFRSQAQHKSGTAVRLNKKYGSIGLLLVVLGVAAMVTGWGDGWLLLAGGVIVLLMGAALVTYYMSFGVFYDADTFLVSGFGRKNRVYHYREIRCQQLYQSYGQLVIELQTEDGKALQLHSAMPGVYEFLDHAFAAWCRQKEIDPAQCSFYDPHNSCWFPGAEDT